MNEFEIIKNYYWVLLEHQIKYLHPALLDDKIRLKTYIEKTEEIKSSSLKEPCILGFDLEFDF